MFRPAGSRLERGWPGRVEGDHVVQLAAQTLQAFFTGGGAAREHAAYPLAETEFLAPVLHPPSVRVFAPFEHRSAPFFSFASPFPVLGPDEELAYPPQAGELVYGLGAAAVVGAEGAIGGFTLANAWTARDLARTERAAGFGPSKSADFGLSLGPLVVTPDEFTGGVLRARVNGVERTHADLAELAHPWGELVAHAAAGTALRPGELLVALAPLDEGPALAPGDTVELELDGVGVLRSRVGAARPAR
jgi:2-keto-4-pentenoate hydratase/2-oxohepta-3-ene-1,7-dioic acid hydratase in catechol pathway